MSESNALKVGLVIAAHAPLAGALQQTAKQILGDAAVSMELVEIQASDVPTTSTAAVESAVESADQGAGVLVLADLFGGSAANVALSQLGEDRVEVVTGANLAMVLEAATYAVRGVSLAELASRVADAARTSVVVAGHLITPIAAGGRTAA
jgi:PTS system mannose-specific IIA component